MTRDASSVPDRARRLPAALAAGLLLVGSVTVLSLVPEEAGASACGPDGEVLSGLPGPTLCVHEDVPPPGVVVTDHVPTAELREREGAGPQAHEAAEELGVATAGAAAVSSPSVVCDGDGTSGYRLQAMYVVEAGRTNRFAALEANLKLWAAGADDVVNRSAALTGGVRHLRYVTEPGPGGTCEADVLNVTVPAGSMSSFNATIQAVQALGYTNPARKYVMWTDATVLCGVASMYLSDDPAQSNPNNGSYAQYARIDSGCWGFGDGAGQHSVEAHEIAHTLGGVQNSAPHSTKAGHCWDERDTMCYADGGSHAMVQVCPPEREYLLDCNTDDYFSTYPEAGSYLDTHWNAADSRFLVGGGDGTAGGAAGTPTKLGAVLGINNPAVPGLATQVSVTPELPEGRSVTSVAWRSARRDCTFSTPAALQSDVTCAATATGTTTVTVTVTDSSGATKTVSGPLAFATGTHRPVELSLSVAAQEEGPASVCTAAPFPVRVVALDVATGQPVKGLAVTFTKRTPSMTAPGAAGAALSTGEGAATVNGVATVATTYAARTATGNVYAAATSSSLVAQPTRCAPTLAGSASAEEVYHGELLTLSGTLTRDVAGVSLPVAGASVPVRLGYPYGTGTRVATLGTARTQADGSWSLAVKPVRGGTLTAVLPASTAYVGTSVDLGELAVRVPESRLTATADRSEVAYGQPVVVTGRLTRTARGVETGAGGYPVTVKVTPAGGRVVTVASGRTLADGTYRITALLRHSGEMTVSYAGSVGLPAASAAVGPVVAHTWSTALTLTGTKTVTSTGATSVLLTGSLTRSYADSVGTVRGLRVAIWFTPSATGVPGVVTRVTTGTTGGFSVRLYPKAAGSYTAMLQGVPGHADATSPGVAVTLG